MADGATTTTTTVTEQPAPQSTPADRVANELAVPVVNPAWYFDSKKWFFKVLRFLNFLEPDRTVLSMTKVMLWGATIQSILVVSTSSDWLTVTGAIGMNVATMLKHESRRRQQGAVTQDGE